MVPQAETQQSPQVLTEATEADLLLLIANVRDYAIVILDPEGRVCSWNNAAEQIKGYQDARGPRQALLDLLSQGGRRGRQAGTRARGRGGARSV